MGNKLTFKQYLDSKAKLLEAIQNTPQQVSKYQVYKYCKLVVGESKDEKEYIPLKPKQTVLVEWMYDDVDDPSVVNVRFENVEGIDDENPYQIFWPGDRLKKWLDRNAREKK